MQWTQVRLGRPDAVRPELLQFCPDAAAGQGQGGQLTAQERHDAKTRAIRDAQVGTRSKQGSTHREQSSTHSTQ